MLSKTKGYASHTFGGALIAKGMLALGMATPDGAAVDTSKITFDNVDKVISQVAEGRPGAGTTRSQGTTDIMLGGAIMSLRRAIANKA